MRHPAVHDLAHVLSDVSTAVKESLQKGGHKRKRMLAESLVWYFVAALGSGEEKRKILDELHECAREHVEIHVEMIKQSGKLRRLWPTLKRQIAYRVMDGIIDRVCRKLDNRF
jgi:hypothetical protein